MIDKTYQPSEVEGRIYAAWEAADAFKAGRPERRAARGQPRTLASRPAIVKPTSECPARLVDSHAAPGFLPLLRRDPGNDR